MRPQRFDVFSLIAGAALAALGALLLLDQLHILSLSFAFFAPAVVATAGVILLARGLYGSAGG